MPDLRSLHLRGATGAVHTEMWDGREHLVVPVVALQEAVIHAVNAPTAEFVPASSLAASVGKWNGHPLVVGHPVKNGKQISAHSPEVLAKHGFGFIRSSAMTGNRLGMEAMVDVARLEALNQRELLADLRAGKGVEVSVGAFVEGNGVKGTHGGKAYDGEWTGIQPDHLAFLPGGIGACSMAMGCGAHRAAMLVTAEGFVDIEEKRPMPKLKDLKARILALFDTPEEAASEEAAELIAYNGMRVQLDAVGDQWDAASDLIDALIADEEENPTVGRAQEAAEEEVEDARLDAIRMHCYSMIAALQSVCNACTEQQAPEPMAVSDPRYMAALESYATATGRELSSFGATDRMTAMRVAIGKSISAKNMKVIQAAHDASHGMHDHTTALGATCESGEMKAAASKDCPTCDGTGQVKADGKQSDCATCDGTGVLKAAEVAAHDAETLRAAGAHPCRCETEGGMMTKAERIAALLKHEHNPIKDQKALEANTDEGLRMLEVHCENATKLKAAADALRAAAECKACKGEGKAFGKECKDCGGTGELKAAEMQAKLAETEAALKAAQAAQIPAEELTQLRALAAAKAGADAAEKAALVEKLVPLKTLTKEQLEAKTLDDLKTLAAFAKIPAPVDYSIKGIPTPRAAEDATSYAAPDPYNLKALQGGKAN